MFIALSHVIDLACIRVIVLERQELNKNACAPMGEKDTLIIVAELTLITAIKFFRGGKK